MGKISEKEMISFAMDFAKAVTEVNGNLLYDTSLRFENSIIYLEDMIASIDEPFEAFEVYETDISLAEFRQDNECEGYLVCEGDLWEKMYWYDAYQVDVLNDSDEAERLWRALYRITVKHGMWYEWDGGAVILYAFSEE